MSKIDKDGNLDLTPGEPRALKEAKRHGYITCETNRYETERRARAQAYAAWCREEDIPCVEVRILERYAIVSAGVYWKYQWGVSLPVFNQINKLVERETTGVKKARFDLDCHFCTICFIPKERADAIATALFHLYQLALNSHLD